VKRIGGEGERGERGNLPGRKPVSTNEKYLIRAYSKEKGGECREPGGGWVGQKGGTPCEIQDPLIGPRK